MRHDLIYVNKRSLAAKWRMNLREAIMSMGKLVSRIFLSSRRKMMMVFCIMEDLVLGIFFPSIVVYNWALLMYEDSIKFCPLVLYFSFAVSH